MNSPLFLCFQIHLDFSGKILKMRLLNREIAQSWYDGLDLWKDYALEQDFHGSDFLNDLGESGDLEASKRKGKGKGKEKSENERVKGGSTSSSDKEYFDLFNKIDIDVEENVSGVGGSADQKGRLMAKFGAKKLEKDQRTEQTREAERVSIDLGEKEPDPLEGWLEQKMRGSMMSKGKYERKFFRLQFMFLILFSYKSTRESFALYSLSHLFFSFQD